VSGVYSFITNAFRYAEAFDNAIRSTYPLARSIEIQGKLTSLTDAEAMKAQIFDVVKSQRFRFETTVIGIDLITPDSFDGVPPCAMLYSDRFGLTGGRLVMIPDFTLDLDKGQTTLRCWG